jgi:ethanolamine ammonia-lyase small subunit
MNDISKLPARDLWRSLRQLTQARIAVGRAGDSLPTSAVLDFEIAQAQARDAVHLSLDDATIESAVLDLGLSPVTVQSSAVNRELYLRRPDLGRRLSDASRQRIHDLSAQQQPGLTLVIGDGLSAAAPVKHAAPLIAALLLHPEVDVNPIVFIATQARVALGDEIGELLNAQAVMMLIGERPGLTTPESLGAYLTWAPLVGRTDAERNCVSNIHANGLSYAAAANKLAVLLRNARCLGATGVDLHDEAHETPPALSVSRSETGSLSTSLRSGRDEKSNR